MARRIVYIDDEAAICRAFTNLLELEGHDIVCFTNPSDAIAYLAANEVALVICDYRMPEMTGLEVLDALIHAVPFYLITGELSTDDLAAGDARVSGILQKPLSPEELLVVARKHAGATSGAPA